MQQHLEKLRIALAIRKEIMEEEFSETDWKWVSPDGGFNLWMMLPESVPMDDFLSKSIEHSITFVPGSICDPLRESKSWIRVCYSYLNEQQLREGVQRMISVYQMLK
jgi:DNA-binding transcriptional MocR family regulator